MQVEYSSDVDGNTTYFVAEDTTVEDEEITVTWYDAYIKWLPGA